MSENSKQFSESVICYQERIQALEAERDRYMAALEYIESTPTTWTLGVDENMERLRTIATQALGGGDE